MIFVNGRFFGSVFYIGSCADVQAIVSPHPCQDPDHIYAEVLDATGELDAIEWIWNLTDGIELACPD